MPIAFINFSSEIYYDGGLKKYKQALQIYRNLGSNANYYFTLCAYYGLFMLVADPKLFEKENLSELMEVNKLHSETFYQNVLALKEYDLPDGGFIFG